MKVYAGFPGFRLGIVAVTVTPMLACAAGATLSTPPEEAAGVWEGEVRTSAASFPLTVAFERGGAGWSGTVDVPSRYALRYPLAEVTIAPGSAGFAFAGELPPGRFEGVLERHRIRGRFTSPLATDTLRGTFSLSRGAPSRTPYTVHEVRFHNGDLELAGTVFQPPGRRPHPAIVLAHGSGPQTRDSYLRWFADVFARAGLVTLIFDKRGSGQSGGERWPLTRGSFADLADDVLAGARLLRARPGVSTDRIGVWGLSQGAWIGPLAVARAPELVGFLVMLSGGGVSPADQELYDDEIKLRDLGFEDAVIFDALSYLRLADEYVRTGSEEDWIRFVRAREEARGEPWYPHLDRFPQILPREAPAWTGLRADLDYDPTPVLGVVDIPVLLILGEEDRLTPAHETARRVSAALESGAGPALTVRVLPAADHALLVKPTPQAPWTAERPADGWVAEMVAWIRGLW